MITKPKGTKDIYGMEAKCWQYVSRVIDEVMEKYNYNFIRVPVFESSELFHRGVGETTDIVTKETYDFTDRGGRSMTLRPEGTAGVVRSFIENKVYGDDNKPAKYYYNMPMYRYERPQAGRLRELTQFGMEIIGTDDPLSDAEIISLAVNIYSLLGLKGIKVNINSLGDSKSRNNYREALIKHFEPHKDELCSDCIERLEKNPLRILDCKVDKDKEIMKTAPKTIDYLNEESKERFEKVKEYLEIMQVKYVVDPSVVRGLDYYNHTVFEIEADIEGFGAQNVIGGGGRYNNMVEQLGGPSTPAIGFAAGFDRLMIALEKENKLPKIDNSVDLFLLYVNEDEKKYAAYLTNELRMSGFIVETDYLARSLKAGFKQADRLNSKFTIVLNSDDLKNNEVKVKNNKTREEELVSVDALIYYLDENIVDEESSLDEHECNCNNSSDHECSCDKTCKCKDKE
ncbi:MAG: histidine--tRNA ligase [Tenericutes bacterium]|nr:histidine--tRNA ligase [Mycoplasmatota bacterium]